MPDAGIGERLREVREYLHLSQQEVSEKTSIPRPSISAIENGKRGVGASELKLLAEVYGYPVGYFLGEAPNPTEEDPRIGALFRATREMSPADKEQVLRFAEYLRFRSRNEEP